MTNPRNRDRVQQMASATTAAVLPPIPTVRSGNPVVDAALSAIKQHLDARAGATSSPLERAATVRDLAALGLPAVAALGKAPDDTTGVPVWTSRRRFELLTTRAMAALLSQHLTTTIEGTQEELDALRRQIALLAPPPSNGLTPELVAQMIAAQPQIAETARWQADVERQILAIQQQLLEALSLATSASNFAAAATLAAGAIGEVARVKLDLGPSARKHFTITFEAPGVEEGDAILMQADPSRSDKGVLHGDEYEMDSISVAACCARGGFITAYITADPGPVCGTRLFFYQVR
jgi:hypothetical protein